LRETDGRVAVAVKPHRGPPRGSSMSRFQELLIEAKKLGGTDVYVSSWLEKGLWKAMIRR
jgi:hypothetical protein